MKELGICFSNKQILEIVSKPLVVSINDDMDKDDNDEEDYDDGGGCDNLLGNTHEKEGIRSDLNDNLITDISAMEQLGVIAKNDCHTIQNRFKCIDKGTISLYTKTHDCVSRNTKHTPFVEVNHNNKTCSMVVSGM